VYPTGEVLSIDYIGPDGILLESAVFHGDECAVTVNLRPIIWRAFEVDATKLLIAHDHPSGDNSPSRSDLAVTRGWHRWPAISVSS